MIEKRVKFSKTFASKIVMLQYKCNFCSHDFENNERILNCPSCNSVDLACKEKKDSTK